MILGKLAGDAAGGILSGISSLIGTIGSAIRGKEALKSEDIAAIETMLNNLQMKVLELRSQLIKAQESIITAEAQGESWLQRNWRPLTMVTFLVIIVYQGVFVSIFSLPAVDFTTIPDKMWTLLSVGIGGYITGRSVEKSVKSWKAGE